MIKLKLKQLLCSLKQPLAIMIPNGEEYIEFSLIKFFNTSDVLMADILYIGCVSELPEEPPETYLNLLCIKDKDLPTQYIDNTHSRIILLDENTSLKSVYNDASQFLEDQYRKLTASKKMLECLVRGNSVQEIIDVGYELLGNPIQLMDTSLKTIAFTKDVKTDVPIWNDFVAFGKTSFEVLSNLINHVDFESILNSKDPKVYESDIFNFKWTGLPVYAKGMIIAHTTVFGFNKPFNDADLNILAELCNAISLTMQKSQLTLHSKKQAYDFFIKNMLSDNYKEIDKMEEKLKYFNLTAKRNWYLVTVDISEFDHSMFTLEYLQGTLESLIPNASSVVYDQKILIILKHDGIKDLTIHDLPAFVDFLKKGEIYAGVSRRFHSFGDLRANYLLSAIASNVAVKLKIQGNLLFYDDCIPQLVIDLAHQHLSREDLCNSSLLRLIEYDKNNLTPFTQTLFHYLTNDRNIASVANSLHVHRSTVLYRIERIQEILERRMEDSEFRFNLLLSFKILNYEE